MVQDHGVQAIVYDPELWYDAPAKRAIMGEDNLDADCRLAESELEAFGRVHQIVETMQASRGNKGFVTTVDEVMRELENAHKHLKRKNPIF